MAGNWLLYVCILFKYTNNVVGRNTKFNPTASKQPSGVQLYARVRRQPSQVKSISSFNESALAALADFTKTLQSEADSETDYDFENFKDCLQDAYESGGIVQQSCHLGFFHHLGDSIIPRCNPLMFAFHYIDKVFHCSSNHLYMTCKLKVKETRRKAGRRKDNVLQCPAFNDLINCFIFFVCPPHRTHIAPTTTTRKATPFLHTSTSLKATSTGSGTIILSITRHSPTTPVPGTGSVKRSVSPVDTGVWPSIPVAGALTTRERAKIVIAASFGSLTGGVIIAIIIIVIWRLCKPRLSRNRYALPDDNPPTRNKRSVCETVSLNTPGNRDSHVYSLPDVVTLPNGACAVEMEASQHDGFYNRLGDHEKPTEFGHVYNKLVKSDLEHEPEVINNEYSHLDCQMEIQLNELTRNDTCMQPSEIDISEKEEQEYVTIDEAILENIRNPLYFVLEG